MKKQEKEKSRKKEEKALLTFLKRTKDGKYAKINKESLPYVRVKEEREDSYDYCEYYYSTR